MTSYLIGDVLLMFDFLSFFTQRRKNEMPVLLLLFVIQYIFSRPTNTCYVSENIFTN